MFDRGVLLPRAGVDPVIGAAGAGAGVFDTFGAGLVTATAAVVVVGAAWFLLLSAASFALAAAYAAASNLGI